jgi:hypothetical protein
VKDSTRARVSAAVASAFKKARVSSVYDHQAGKHRQVSADTSQGTVSGYDHDTSTHFVGGGSSNLNFYDYETSTHVLLRLEGDKFSGYDYHTQSHFQGTVSKNSVSLYDHEKGQHYIFTA